MRLRDLWFNDEAQDIAEYAILLAVLLVVVLASIKTVGSNVQEIMERAADVLENAIKKSPPKKR